MLAIFGSRKSRDVMRRGVWRDGSRLRAVRRDEKCPHFIYRDLISAVGSAMWIDSQWLRQLRAGTRWSTDCVWFVVSLSLSDASSTLGNIAIVPN